jgi:hypothetical protein
MGKRERKPAMTEHDKPYDPSEHEPMPEGEEGAPRLAGTMAVVRWVILGAMVLFAVIMILTYFARRHGHMAAAGRCITVMHPTYVSNQPGVPYLRMSLVRSTSSGKAVGRSPAAW